MRPFRKGDDSDLATTREFSPQAFFVDFGTNLFRRFLTISLVDFIFSKMFPTYQIHFFSNSNVQSKENMVYGTLCRSSL
jgi:hypothetical protein